MRQSSKPSTSSFGVEWEPDSASSVCRVCSTKWGIFTNRRHHCRKCGRLVCDGCSKARVNLFPYDKKPSRTCDDCLKPQPPLIIQPIEFIRVRSKIPFSDESPTLLGSPEAMFRKSLIADHAKVASVIEESERSLLLDLSNQTGNGATESALLDAVGAEEEVYSDEGEDEEEDAPGNPVRQLLNLEEMSSHLSVHHSQVSSASPKSEGGNSILSESTDTPPPALFAVKEGQVDVHKRLSAGKPTKELRLSISKFGAMDFTDDNDNEEGHSAPPSTMSFYEGSVNAFPLSPDAPQGSNLLSPMAMLVSAAPEKVKTSESTEKKPVISDAAVGVGVLDAPQSNEDISNVHMDANTDAISSAAPATPSDKNNPIEKNEEPLSTPENSSSPGYNDQAAADANKHTPKSAPKSAPKVALKGTPTGGANASKIPKLTPGLSPMPSGNNVRRLSTLVPRGSPYTVSKSIAAAAEGGGGGGEVASSSSAPVVPSPAAVVTTVGAASTATTADTADCVADRAAVATKVATTPDMSSAVATESQADCTSNGVDTTTTGESNAGLTDTFTSISVDASPVSAPTVAHVDAHVDEPAEPTAPTVAAPCAFSPPKRDINGIVSDTKKVKGGKRNANSKGRGLKM